MGVVSYKGRGQKLFNLVPSLLEALDPHLHPIPYEVEIKKKLKLYKGVENEYTIMTQQSQGTVATTNTTNGPICTYNFNLNGCFSITCNLKAPT